MSYYRRGYSWENIQYLPAPVGGWNPDANPWEIPESQAAVLDNMFVRSDCVSGRNPIGKMGLVSGIQNPFTCAGGVSCVYEMLLSYATTQGVPACRVPINYNAAARQVISSNVVIARTNNTGSIVSQAATIDQAPGFRWINFDGLMYGIGAGSNGATVPDVNSNYAMPPLKLLTMNPSLVLSVTVPTVHTLAPQGALDLLGYQSRIWLLGGVDTPGAGTTHSSTTLFFTNPGVSGVGGATSDWQDPVSGLTNQIVMDRNTQDCGIGLAKVRNGMVVLRKNSVWLLRGTTSSNYLLQVVAPDVGCLDSRSIVETAAGVYFLSQRGMMFTDGVRVIPMGGPVQETLRSAIALTQGPSSGSAAYQMNLMSTGHILVSIVIYSGLSVRPIWSGIFDVTTKTWSRFTSNLMSTASSTFNPLGYPAVLVQNRGNGKLHCVDDVQLYVLEDQAAQGILGGSFAAPYASSNNLGFWDVDLTSSYAPVSTGLIPFRWDTRFMPVVGTTTNTRKFGQAKRWFLDYAFQSTPTNGQTTPTGGWQVAALDASRAAVGSPATAPYVNAGLLTNESSINASWQWQAPMIQRFNQAFVSEMSDLFFRITPTMTFPTPLTILDNNCSAKLFGIGIEYQPGGDLR